MRKNWTDALAVLGIALVLVGCSTTKEQLLPHNNQTMLDTWNVETGGGVGEIGRAHV